MTSPRYYDVTHFLTDLYENCTAYVKLKIKDVLFVINYENHANCPVTLHMPPIPFGPPRLLGWVLLGTHKTKNKKHIKNKKHTQQ